MITDFFELKRAIRPISVTDLWKGYKKKIYLFISIVLIALSLIGYFTINFQATGAFIFLTTVIPLGFVCLIPLFTIVILPAIFNIMAIISFLILSFIDFSIEVLNSINFLK